MLDGKPQPEEHSDGEDDLTAALAAAERADAAMRSAFRALVEAPARYADEREALDRLDEERRAALAALGEIALRRSREARLATVNWCAPSEPSTEASHVEALPAAEPPASPASSPIAEEAPPHMVAPEQLAPEAARPLTAEELRARLSVLATPAVAAPRPVGDDRSLLRRIIGPFCEPSDTSTVDRAIGEIDELDAATSENALGRWVRFRQPTQRLLLALFVARVRALQDAPATPPMSRARLNEIFARLREFLRTEQPGVVYGYARDHVPRGASWSDDALRAYEELAAVAGLGRRVDVAADAREVPQQGEAGDDGDDGDDEVSSEVEPELPADWSHWSQVHGRAAVLFGGAPREERRVVLERALRLRSLDWVEGGRPREAESLVARVRSGSVDLLFITKFASHKDTDRLVDAAKTSGTPFFVLRHGYGVMAVRGAIELVAGKGRAGGDGSR